MSKSLRPARVYNIQVKSHKMTIVHAGLPPTMKVTELKKQTLAALQADVSQDALDVLAMDPPEFDIQTIDDFELCRTVRDKGKPTDTFELLEPSKILRESGISGWEALFLQFRDHETVAVISLLHSTTNAGGLTNRSIGNLLPIKYTLPPLYDDEEPAASEGDSKGKRKADVAFDESLGSSTSLGSFIKDPADVSVEIDDATLDF